MGIGRERLKARIKMLVADFIQQRLTDPRKGFITVTRVELSQDFRQAKIHISILGEPGDISKSLHMLADARGRVRSHVATNLDTRFAPEILFIHDQSIEKSFRMEKLFDQIARERGDEPEDENAEDVDQGLGEEPEAAEDAGPL